MILQNYSENNVYCNFINVNMKCSIITTQGGMKNGPLVLWVKSTLVHNFAKADHFQNSFIAINL